MIDLWAAGERDMLNDGSKYSLKNTGHGLERVQGQSVALISHRQPTVKSVGRLVRRS